MLVSEYDFNQIPFQNIVHFGQRSLLYRDLFVVSWLLGRYCNYRCSYCWPYARADVKDHRPYEVIEKTMNEIIRQARERNLNSFHFSFSGGEPTLHPNYLEILQHLGSYLETTNYQSTHMTSNCSQPIRWFEKYTEATKNFHRVSVTASYHKEFAKKDVLAEKLIFLQRQDVQVTINMVMVPERFDLLWQDALFFHEKGINVTLKPQSNKSATKIVDGYTDEQIKMLKVGMPQIDYTSKRQEQEGRLIARPKSRIQGPSINSKSGGKFQVELTDKNEEVYFLDQAERLNSFGFNNFKDWICSAGYRSIIIREPDGVIKRGYSCADPVLGTLENGFQLFNDPQPCISSSCVSSADNKIPKRKKDCTKPLMIKN